MFQSFLYACLFLAPSVRQDNAKLVDDMIARSNALKSFVATYKAHPGSKADESPGPEVIIRLVYRAPDDLLAEIKTADSRTLSAIAGGRIFALVEKGDGTVQHGEADLETTLVQERARITRIFHEKFPALGALDELTSLGAYLSFTWRPGTGSVRPSFNMQVGTGRGDEPLLDWLGRLKRSSAQLATEGEFVAWEPAEGCRVLIRKDSGFIEKIVSTYGGETKTAIELADLALDTEVGDEEFRFPKIAASTADSSESMSKSLGMRQLTSMRSSIQRKTREAVEAGTLEWTSDTRAGLGAVLRAFHSEFAPFYLADSIRSSRSEVDKYCLWHQERKLGIPKDASKDDIARAEALLEEQQVGWEEKYRASLEKLVEAYLARGVPDSGGKNASKVSVHSRAVELEAAESACRKSVVEPTLEYLQQQMDLARRGELPPSKN